MTATSPRPRIRAAELPADDPAAVSDQLGDRLQARLEAIEADPQAQQPSRRWASSSSASAPGRVPADSDDDLDTQLHVLRGQLEVAFDEMEARITAAERSARAARARIAEVVSAIDELANDLPRLADPRTDGDVDRLHAALTRLRARLRPR